MKKIFSFLVALAMSISLSSCVTTAVAQDDAFDDGVKTTVIISYGTPFLNDDGLIMYYYYRGWYYYPYYIGDRYCFHRYRRVLPPQHFGNWYRPIPRGHFHQRPHMPRHVAPPRQNHHGGGMYRPHNPNMNGGGHRPMHQPRSSTRGGHFGGRR
jgi:hypothetical protein